MPVDPVKIPLQEYLFVDNNLGAGQSIDLLAVYGALYLRNSAADPLWFVPGTGVAAPVAPPAANGPGCTRLGPGESIGLDDIACQYITAITAGATTAALQIIAVKRPGISGYGAT